MIRVLAFLGGGLAGFLIAYHFLLDTMESIAFRLWREDVKRGVGFFDFDTLVRSSTAWKLIGSALLFGFVAAVLAGLFSGKKKRSR